MNFIPQKRKRPKMGLRPSPWFRSQRHLKFIRSLTCVLEGKEGHICVGVIEAMHVRTETDGCASEKPSDFWTIPGCSHAHRLQHSVGERAWEKDWRVDMKQISNSLCKTSPCAAEIAEWRREHG